MPDPETGTVSPDRPLDNAVNKFWRSHSIRQTIAGLDRDDRQALLSRLDDIHAFYNDVSTIYQNSKGSKGIPLV